MALNARAQSIALWLEAIGHVSLGEDIPTTGIEHLLDSLKGSSAFHNPRIEHHPAHGPMIVVTMDAPKHRPDRPHQRWFGLAEIAAGRLAELGGCSIYLHLAPKTDPQNPKPTEIWQITLGLPGGGGLTQLVRLLYEGVAGVTIRQRYRGPDDTRYRYITAAHYTRKVGLGRSEIVACIRGRDPEVGRLLVRVLNLINSGEHPELDDSDEDEALLTTT